MKRFANPMTGCVHSGTLVDEKVGGVGTPVHCNSAVLFTSTEDIGYPRYHNLPPQQAVADKMAALEGAEAGFVFASGMAAISTALMSLMRAGDHAVIQADAYGGTHYFATREMPRLGLEATLVEDTSVEGFRAAMRPNTKAVVFETPSNPLLNVLDIRGIADMARGMGAATLMDNTFASPMNQTPLALGVDVVMHSATKYLGGHDDMCAGAVVSNREFIEHMFKSAKSTGSALAPRECSLLERSMKTLGVRMRQHNDNGLAVAEFLENHPKVRKVHYPGLASHPGHELAKSQMADTPQAGFGGMMSMELDCDADQAMKVVDSLELIAHAISLGGVQSLVCFPALTSHSMMPEEERKKAGITDSLVRISVGIEDAGDIVADLDQALARIL